ncbi:copper binding s, plastocyanin/azurin family protein [Collimonas arenae]|uniref:Copper binding s, plastocyanin/azurin family protein n=2 Tax=Collimonas arenae TaxID=279058 RepID=A0A127QGK4_9BURK|nr:copper binding s, plastocyanin/azurin family protein [Collimonas arenae]
MKSILIASTLVFSLLSLNAFAHGEEGQDTSTEQQGGHAAASGRPGVAANVSKTMQIDMSDTMRFAPENISVKRGDTVKFIVTNSGKVKHEMVLGSIEELKEHAALMVKFPEMEHADANQVSLDPGKAGELIWQFDKAGIFDFACLQPGHFEAGMRGKIIVK